MRAVDIIEKKRDGLELSTEEIRYFIQGFNEGEIPDYQASAWAMAVLFQGMTPRETHDLTMALAESGEILDLSSVVDIALDKHSTGGVGDKTTLVVAPIVAGCGIPVGKMSGRGLGFTGGTLDKMESIPGFQVDLTTEGFLDQLREVGIVLSGQTADLAPADGKLYALRDVTGTVPSIPLIASSVMSKKIAGGANAIVLDVKTGLGAFMQDLGRARELAQLMVDIGTHAGRRVTALISDMNQPLGHAVGNALEVREALDTLMGGGPEDFREHCLVVAAHMLYLSGRFGDFEDARRAAEQSLKEGDALAKLKALVQAQGGDLSYVEDPTRLPAAPVIRDIDAPASGYLSKIHARVVGMAAMHLGAGRARKGDSIDHAVGVIAPRKVGDLVERGQPIFRVHARSETALDEAAARLLQACEIVEKPPERLPLFYAKLTNWQGAA